MGGGQTTTVEKASPLQEVQAQYAQQIAPYLMNQIKGGMAGYPSNQQMGSYSTAIQSLRQQAGTMGVQPGDPRIMESIRMITEGLTKPDPDIMKTALSLYLGAPTPGGSQQTTTSPSGMEQALGYTGIGSAIAMLLSALGVKIA